MKVILRQANNGRSSGKNLKEADLLENANKGDPKAQYNLGLMALASSKKKDINRALNWFNLAAIKAFPPAQYSMGVSMIKGWASQKTSRPLCFGIMRQRKITMPKRSTILGFFS